MNTARELNDHNALSDLFCLMGHVGRISIWERRSLPAAKRVARQRANERRLRIIKELSHSVTRSLQEQWLGA